MKSGQHCGKKSEAGERKMIGWGFSPEFCSFERSNSGELLDFRQKKKFVVNSHHSLLTNFLSQLWPTECMPEWFSPTVFLCNNNSGEPLSVARLIIAVWCKLCVWGGLFYEAALISIWISTTDEMTVMWKVSLVVTDWKRELSPHSASFSSVLLCILASFSSLFWLYGLFLFKVCVQSVEWISLVFETGNSLLAH